MDIFRVSLFGGTKCMNLQHLRTIIPNLVFNNFLKYYIYKSTTHIFALKNYNTKCRSQCRSCRLPVPIEATRHTSATMSLCVQRPHIDSQLDKRRLPVPIEATRHTACINYECKLCSYRK